MGRTWDMGHDGMTLHIQTTAGRDASSKAGMKEISGLSMGRQHRGPGPIALTMLKLEETWCLLCSAPSIFPSFLPSCMDKVVKKRSSTVAAILQRSWCHQRCQAHSPLSVPFCCPGSLLVFTVFMGSWSPPVGTSFTCVC